MPHPTTIPTPYYHTSLPLWLRVPMCCSTHVLPSLSPFPCPTWTLTLPGQVQTGGWWCLSWDCKASSVLSMWPPSHAFSL